MKIITLRSSRIAKFIKHEAERRNFKTRLKETLVEEIMLFFYFCFLQLFF